MSWMTISNEMMTMMIESMPVGFGFNSASNLPEERG
jgi:hypothetical protein